MVALRGLSRRSLGIDAELFPVIVDLRARFTGNAEVTEDFPVIVASRRWVTPPPHSGEAGPQIKCCFCAWVSAISYVCECGIVASHGCIHLICASSVLEGQVIAAGNNKVAVRLVFVKYTKLGTR